MGGVSGAGGLAQKLVDSACLAPKTDGKWKPLHFFDKVHVTYFVKSLEVLLSIPYFPNNIPDSVDVFNRTGNLCWSLWVSLSHHMLGSDVHTSHLVPITVYHQGLWTLKCSSIFCPLRTMISISPAVGWGECCRRSWPIGSSLVKLKYRHCL